MNVWLTSTLTSLTSQILLSNYLYTLTVILLKLLSCWICQYENNEKFHLQLLLRFIRASECILLQEASLMRFWFLFIPKRTINNPICCDLTMLDWPIVKVIFRLLTGSKIKNYKLDTIQFPLFILEDPVIV